MNSEIREPWIRRERMSRPKLSVPRTCPGVPGGAYAFTRSILYGSCGAMRGASRADPSITTRTAVPARARRLRKNARRTREGRPVWAVLGAATSAIADARVDRRVEQVREQRDHHEACREHEHRALHRRQVALPYGVDGEQAEARPREDRLDDHGAAQKRAELHPGRGHERQHRVAQCVAEQDRAR